MRTTTGIDLETVKAVYAGPERSLWELIMGEQIHVGGLESSMALADAADISPGTYQLLVGLYNEAGRSPLILADGRESDHLELPVVVD